MSASRSQSRSQRAWSCFAVVGMLAGIAGCDRSPPGQLARCQSYRPALAKRTFDGRVGAVLVHNGTPRRAEVKVYHPDGSGDVELRWWVPAGQVLALTGDDGERLALGNDWGLQVDRSCVRTLGEFAQWRSGEFRVLWSGDSLRAANTRETAAPTSPTW